MGIFLGTVTVQLRGKEVEYDYSFNDMTDSVDYKTTDIMFRVFPLTPEEERLVEEAVLEDMTETCH